MFIASAVVGLIILATTKKSSPPSSMFMAVYAFSSFIISMCWISLLCDLIVNCLELFGDITGLPASFLGLTILSWGNSLLDYFATTAIAKRGLGEMAITGVIAGPIFNILVGLGVTALVCNLRGGSINFDIHGSEGLSTLAAVVSTLIVHIVLAWIVFINDFKVDKY